MEPHATLGDAVSGACSPCLQSDTATQLTGAATVPHHPVGHDVTYFPELFERMSELVDIGTAVPERGYDKRIHVLIRAADAVSVIPARGDDVLVWRTDGRHRRQMRRNLPKERTAGGTGQRPYFR